MTQADSVQGYSIRAEHSICFVGDTMNISATGPSMSYVSLLFFNSSGNQTNTFLLQLNYTGEGVRHISTDNIKPDTYTIELAVMNSETEQMEIVANTTVSLVYDPVHILQKKVAEQNDKIQDIMEANRALREETEHKVAEMRNNMIISILVVAGFFLFMLASIDWQGGLLSNRTAIVKHLPPWLEAIWGGKRGANRGMAWAKGMPPQWYSEALAATAISHAERAFKELTNSLQEYKELTKHSKGELPSVKFKAWNLKRRINALNKIIIDWQAFGKPDYYEEVRERMKGGK